MKRSSLYLAILALALDLAAVFVGMLLAYALRADGLPIYRWPFSLYLRMTLLTLPVWLIAFTNTGLYNIRLLPRGWNAIGKLLTGLLMGWGAVLIALYLWRSPAAQALPRLIIVYGIGLTTLLLFAEKTFYTDLVNVLFKKGVAVTKTVVVAARGNEDFACSVIKTGTNGRKVVATLASIGGVVGALKKLVSNKRVDEVLINDPHIDDAILLELLNWTENCGIDFTVVPSLLSVRTTNVEIGTLAGTPVMYFLRTPLEGWRRVVKRIFDLVLSGMAIIILSPVLLILAVLEKISSPGPILYKEKRIGQDGREFFVHKFRSMYADWRDRFPDIVDWSADESKDMRITRLGRIIRRTNLDELPQLWDIFRGVMSIVGPRPEQPKYVEKFSNEIPGYLKRHRVKTGLTGWAQVNGLRGDTSVAERVKYDLFYIENWSIWFDIRIILATFVLVFRQITGKFR